MTAELHASQTHKAALQVLFLYICYGLLTLVFVDQEQLSAVKQELSDMELSRVLCLGCLAAQM